MMRAATFAILFFLCMSPFYSQSKAGASAQLRKLIDEEWETRMREFPEGATLLGDNRYNHRVADWSPEAIERRRKYSQGLLGRVEAIHRSRLAEGDRIHYDLFLNRLRLDVAGDAFPQHWMPLNQMEGIQTQLATLAALTPFRAARDYEDYLARLRAVPKLVEQTTALMREGIKQGYTLPRIVLRTVPAQIQALVDEDPARTVFYAPFRKIAPQVTPSERLRFEQDGRRAIAEHVLPAFRKFADFFSREYLPAARTDVSIRALPRGDALYAYLVRLHTTTDWTAQRIHEIGMEEVGRIRARMEEVIRQAAFQGDFNAFVAFLRTDPRFYYKTAEELLTGYRDICKRTDPELVRLFGVLPRTTYGVIAVPDNEAPSTTTAYYREPAMGGLRPGYFYANTYKLESRPKYEMEALALHESVPGHHLQIALAQELEGLPNFRRYGSVTAFVEGWGLYAESLGEEMGFYRDPYSKFGQLTYEMWRACRLVVDTGMHALGWDRQRAIDFMKDNTAKAEHDIVVEIDRYIAWPGQALAYKIGELRIKELRLRAASQLGDRFDLRKFHDVVLGSGAVPLDVLEKNVNKYIVDGK
ncbi:MAG: DUF885 domain-containing protein [Candidatus Limnocylindria bacterium]